MAKSNLTYYKKIFSDLDKRELSSLYLLQGPEYYIMEEMAGKIASSIVPDDLKSFNMTLAYGAEVDIDEFVRTARSFPFISDKRVLLLKEMERFKGSWKNLVSYCEDPVPSSVVIMLFNPLDESGRRSRQPRDYKRLEAGVKARGQVLTFNKLAEGELVRWVTQKAKRMNIKMTPDTVEILVRSVGENLFDIKNELEKLSLYFDGGTLERDDLARVIGSYRLDSMFDLINGIQPGMNSGILTSLARIINTGAERPSVVIYQTIRHFLALLKIKAGVGGGGYRYTRLKEKADRFGLKEILLWLENLRVADITLKSVSFPEETVVMAAFIHSMAGEFLESPSASISAA
ncbi:MAG: DNA polymerase III subunit delta [Candidatus Krumholzibacteria bacterium]|nr:DNA polymerase III subunit delta [Candidatus Krumholzibacteria bacterium]